MADSRETLYIRFVNAGAPHEVARLLAVLINDLQQRVDEALPATLQQRVGEVANMAASARALNTLSGRVAALEAKAASSEPAHLRHTEKR